MPLALRVGEKFVGPGTIADVALGGAEPLKVRVVAGQATGPKLFIVAGLHGDERVGIAIADEVAETLDARFVHGVVYIVARAAETAVKQKLRNLPECPDLNRCFPGSRQGGAAHEVAWHLFHDIVSKCDFGVDLHAAGVGRTSIPHARGNLGNHYVRRLCESFGASVILDCSGPPRSLRRAATDFGVPTFAFEAGGAGRTEKSVVQEGVRGALGVMANLRMIGGEIPWRGSPTILKDGRWLVTKAGGAIDVLTAAGASVRAGEVLARVEGGETINAPRAGLVLAVTTEKQLPAGGLVVELALVVDPALAASRSLEDA